MSLMGRGAVGRPLRISDLWDAVDTLNWSRNDLWGATLEEFVWMDVRARMEKYIAVVEALSLRVPTRFTLDLVRAEESVRQARQAIQK